ncbi:MAG: lytic murein transglycosylase [Solirubrobacterales bacterium]
MGRFRSTVAAALVAAAIAAQGATAQTTPDPSPATATTPADPAAGQQLVPAPPPAPRPKPVPRPSPKPAPKPSPKPAKGQAPDGPGGVAPGHPGAQEEADDPAVPDSAQVTLPSLAMCGSTSVPAFLIPIYQSASNEYGLGAAGPSILAAINEIETGFGVNQGPSSAGAIGWMQFMPATWAAYGVDANGDGVRDPSDPEDAIFAAARYLRAGGMPSDPEGAIFAYNHADWYVADVLERAACYSGVGGGPLGALTLVPRRQELVCAAAKPVRNQVPELYMRAFQRAAGRFDLGADGVWALAAVARLESDFGRGMSAAELRERGPLGISDANWDAYAVDGDGDGRARRVSPGDAAATLARMIWAAGSMRAGIFVHNHASWYVDEVLDQAKPLEGECRARTVAYAIALPGPTALPINWENLELSNSLELWDLQQGAVDPRVVALIAAISQDHNIRISSLRSDPSMNTVNGGVSNHFFGRAVDIAAIDGVPCTVTSVDSPCGTMVRALASLDPSHRPSELIFCFDADGPGPAFAAADHCDHIHAGFDS